MFCSRMHSASLFLPMQIAGFLMRRLISGKKGKMFYVKSHTRDGSSGSRRSNARQRNKDAFIFPWINMVHIQMHNVVCPLPLVLQSWDNILLWLFLDLLIPGDMKIETTEDESFFREQIYLALEYIDGWQTSYTTSDFFI